MQGLHLAAALPFGKQILSNQFQYTRKDLTKDLFGLHFPNPVGLGAGFDKNAEHLDVLELLGFGFVEIGTVTPKAQAGNPAPRLFRLPSQKALINRMGFNNDGVEAIATRLKKRKEITNSRLIIGGNIGKNKITENQDAWKDYCINFTGLEEVVDYFVVNVSSPNTPGLRALQEKESLRKLFSELQNLNKNNKPILLKIAPDLEHSALDDIIALTQEVKIDGLVSSNTTLDRGLLNAANLEKANAIGAGGLSGQPLLNKSNQVLEYLHKGIGDRLPIIASGGILTGEDAQSKINAGADLVQVWTGFIYEGPSMVNNICTYLSKENQSL
jgi:dihydroorotate dehydrogenase